MKISIFPKINYHPTKDEKPDLSKLSSKPNRPVQKEFDDEYTLFELITQYGWSPSVFTGYRENASFSFCDVMAIDIDDGMSIQDAEVLCKSQGLSAMIAPSPSNTPEDPRFRVIFPLVRRISSKLVFDATWTKLASIFPQLDTQCKDYARFYFPCWPDEENSVWVEGDFLEPAEPDYDSIKRASGSEYVTVKLDEIKDGSIYEYLYNEIPERLSKPVAHFIENAHTGMSGEWINSLNACCFTLACQGVPHERIWSAMNKVAPAELDDKDEYQIDRALADGDEIHEADAYDGYKYQEILKDEQVRMSRLRRVK